MLILVTSAELDAQNKLRTFQYLNTIKWLKENVNRYKIIWIECVKNNISYLGENFSVYYPNCYNPNYSNKGSNLGKSLENFFNNNEIKENLVVQITGRYKFLSRYFFDFIEKNQEYDFYGVQKIEHKQCFTGCFAMKTNHFKNWLVQTDWDHLNNSMINIEKSLWDYNCDCKLKCMYLDKIDMEASICGNGEYKLIYF